MFRRHTVRKFFDLFNKEDSKTKLPKPQKVGFDFNKEPTQGKEIPILWFDSSNISSRVQLIKEYNLIFPVEFRDQLDFEKGKINVAYIPYQHPLFEILWEVVYIDSTGKQEEFLKIEFLKAGSVFLYIFGEPIDQILNYYHRDRGFEFLNEDKLCYYFSDEGEHLKHIICVSRRFWDRGKVNYFVLPCIRKDNLSSTLEGFIIISDSILKIETQ